MLEVDGDEVASSYDTESEEFIMSLMNLTWGFCLAHQTIISSLSSCKITNLL